MTTQSPDQAAACTAGPLVLAQRSQLCASAVARASSVAAAGLSECGVTRSDRVGLLMENTAESVVLLLALARLGCSIAVLDPRQFTGQAAMADAVALDHLIVPRPTTARRGRAAVSAVRPDAGNQIGVHAAADLVALPPGTVCHCGHGPGTEEPVGDLGRWPWADRVDGLVQITSGSTGVPGVVEKAPGQFLANCRRTAAHLGYRADDVLQPILPLSHQYGLSVLLIGLDRGIPVVVAGHQRWQEAIRLGRRLGVTVIDSSVPLWDAVAHAVERRKLSVDVLDGVRMLGVGGGTLPTALAERVHRLTGRHLLDGYGSTELGNVALARPGRPDRMDPLPGVRVRVVDDTGRALAAGAPGLLEVATPDDPLPSHPFAADAPFGGRWRRTGDLAVLRSDGSLVVRGRYQAVNRNGLLTYPGAVEARLGDAGFTAFVHGVAGTDAVNGVDDDDRLVVVVADRYRRLPAHWNRVVSELVPEQDRPDRTAVVVDFPRTAGGKVDRERLSAFARRLARPPTTADPLTAVALRIEERRDELLRIMSTYSSREAARIEVDAALAALRGGAAELALHRPPGIPASWVYLPSNVVLYSYVLYLLIPGQFTATAWFRPSSRSREAALAIHRVLAGSHAMDVRAFDGSQRAFERLRRGRPGLVVFTGRHANAEEVRAALGDRQLMIFFGQGTNPFVVGAAANVPLAVRDAVDIRLLNSGQDCFGPDVYLVHESVADEFERGVLHRLDPFGLDRLASVSPDEFRRTTDELVVRDLSHHILRHRAAVRWGGRMDLSSGLIEPTVLRWPIASAPDCAEVFAPVFHVITYAHEDDVSRLLDRPFYRQRMMGASLYGVGPGLRAWMSEDMTVSLDTTLVAADDPNQPFGGSGPMANYVATARTLITGPQLISRVVADHAEHITGPEPLVAAPPPLQPPAPQHGTRPHQDVLVTTR